MTTKIIHKIKRPICIYKECNNDWVLIQREKKNEK